MVNKLGNNMETAGKRLNDAYIRYYEPEIARTRDWKSMSQSNVWL